VFLSVIRKGDGVYTYYDCSETMLIPMIIGKAKEGFKYIVKRSKRFQMHCRLRSPCVTCIILMQPRSVISPSEMQNQDYIGGLNMIKKFKNGNVLLKLDGQWDESFYHNDMFWNDLYFNQINGYMYLVDYNTQRMYDFSDCYMNILDYLKDELAKKNNQMRLYPIPKKESKQLFVDLDNGM
jgi:hypothetical protein